MSRIGLLTPELLKRFRRHAVIACLILAAFLTPPDPISQILIGIPLVVLYEFAIVISRFAVKQRERDLKKALSDND